MGATDAQKTAGAATGVPTITEDDRRAIREFNSAIRAFESLYDTRAHDLGMPAGTFDVLYALYAEGQGCSQRVLCDRCYANKQTVNSTVQRLRREGLVRMEPGPGRQTRVFLTDEGQRVAQAAIGPVVDAELAVMGEMSRGGRETFLALLRRYVTSMRERFERMGVPAAIRDRGADDGASDDARA